MRGLKAVILCDTPSARMNCSRNSMLVRPLAFVLVSIFRTIKAARKLIHNKTNIKSKNKHITDWQSVIKWMVGVVMWVVLVGREIYIGFANSDVMGKGERKTEKLN